MQQHFAEEGEFRSEGTKALGKPITYVAKRSKSYAVAVDTRGSLILRDEDLDGDHLICALSEQVPEQYLDDLRGKGISYMVAGSSAVDLEKIVESLYRDFGINTLLLEGGGKINGAFLQAGLLDEVSLLLAPGIDGRDGIPTLLDGRNGEAGPAIPLRLRSVQELKSGILWIRYDVANNAANV